jgi:2-methylcitrate dehydratase PrpD
MTRTFILFVFIFNLLTGGVCFGVDQGKIVSTSIQLTELDSVDAITLALSKLVIETDANEIPDSVYMAAKAAMLDALGCAFAGHDGSGVPEIISLTKHWGGLGESTIWFDGTRVPVTEATFVNSVQLHAMDFDDYHPPSDAHITAVLVPTVLAVGELNNASGKEILAALVLGAEVIGRLGSAYKARRTHAGFLPTSVIGGFGATAAACRLQNCSVEETVNAMGIWYAHASGNRQALYDRTLTKRIQPGIAAKASVFACYLANEGITGPNRIIGNQPGSLMQIYGCNPDLEAPKIDELMPLQDAWQIEQLDYKRYACCGYSSMAIKTAIEFSSMNDIKPENIKEIRLFGDNIDSPFAGVMWDDSPTPQVLAQFCVTYAVASATKNLRYGPDEIAVKRINEDRDVDSLARRIKICDWSEWVGSRPDASFAMQIDLKDGNSIVQTFESFKRYEWPEDYDGLISKFEDNIAFSGMLDESEAEEFIIAIEKLDECNNIGGFIKKWLVP